MDEFRFDMDEFRFDMDEFRLDMDEFRLDMDEFRLDMDEFRLDMDEFCKIGIFGGTFDPIHLGHIGCAEAAAKALHLDKVFFVPTGVSNFKQEQRTAPRAARVEMCRLAIEGHDGFGLDTFDASQAGISYTVDTVKHFHKIYPQAELYFITGSDAALTFDKWHKYREILEHATLVAVSRKGAPVEEGDVKDLHNVCAGKVVFVEADVVDISSHELREMISAYAEKSSSNKASRAVHLEESGCDGSEDNAHLFNFVDRKVSDYIFENSLYR